MSELRWHPLLREWVITATERQERTFLPPPGTCPLCPQQPDGPPTEIPEPFRIVAFDNRFPSLQREPPEPAVAGNALHPVEPARGVCEVIVYTPEHQGSLTERSVAEIEELVWVWRDRYEELGARPELAYVYIFENKGEVIGVTLHHPHGQLYAFPFVPPRLERELESLAAHRERTGRCLVCDVAADEEADGRRVIARGERFTAAVPFFARWPYEVHLWAREHRPSLAHLSPEEVRELARTLKTVLLKYDNLWGRSMPYLMILKQLPTDGRPEEADHFRIEFLPPYRSREKLKYPASVETGAGNFINDTLAEEKAAELRAAAPAGTELAAE